MSKITNPERVRRIVSPVELRQLLDDSEIQDRIAVEEALQAARKADVIQHQQRFAPTKTEPVHVETEDELAEKPARAKHSKWALGALAVAITASGFTLYTVQAESPDTCTSTTKIEVEGGQAWDDVSRQVTALTGLAISATRLQRANEGDVPTDEACLNLPAPIVGGQFETPDQMSLEEIANASGETLEDLLKLNKEIATAPDEPIPQGTIVWLKPVLNKDLVLQPYKGQQLTELTGGTGKGLVEFVTNNAASLVLQDDLNLEEDEPYLLPVEKVEGPKLKEHELTQKEIIEAQPATYDPTKRKKLVPIEKSPAATPAEDTNPNTGLTVAQEKLVAGLEVSEHNREFLSSMTSSIMKLRAELDGIDPAVMAAQAILESAENGQWGTSLLAENHNYFGMKANNGWTGPTVNKETFEYDTAGNKITITDTFRAYPSREAGVKGYIDNIKSKKWYDDARRCGDDYLIGLLKKLGPNCEIAGDEPAYATSPTYREQIEGLMAQYKLNDLMAPALKDESPKTPETTPPTRRIDLDSSKYSDKRDVSFWRPNGQVRVGNSWITPKDMTQEERLTLIEVTLNQVRVSAGGYEKFKSDIIDLRSTIAGDSFFANFNTKTKSNGEPYGRPQNMGEVSCLVNHYMAISQGAVDKLSPIELARSMQNGGNGVAVQMSITRDGKLALYTDNYTVHAKNNGDGTVYNGKAYGIEVAATSQEGVTAKQYETLVYTNVRFLVEGGFIEKGKPVTPIVKAKIVGHGEVNNMVNNGHTDFNTIFMDQAIRPYVVDVLVAMGYTA